MLENPLLKFWLFVGVFTVSNEKLLARQAKLNLTNSRGPEICAELYMDGPNAKREFAALERQKDSIETSLGFPLVWRNASNKASCRLYTRQNADFLNQQLWPQHFEWLRQRLETMQRDFAPIVRNLGLEGMESSLGAP